MNEKATRPSNQPITSGYSLSITHAGKTWGICDSAQFRFMIAIAMQELFSEGLVPDDKDEFEELAAQRVEDKGISTQKRIIAKMSPEEKETWKQAYRFAPLQTRNIGAQR